MLTPDQVKVRLDAIRYHESDNGMADMVTLLYELLPDLVALANGRTADDAGRRYGGDPPYGGRYVISSGMGNERCMNCGMGGHSACSKGGRRYGGGVPGRMYQERNV